LLRAAAVILVCVTAAVPLWADLETVKAEPNIEKRSRKALENAQEALKRAQDAYNAKSDLAATNAALEELERSVQLCYDSLIETGKTPSRSPKHFKRAEIGTRELLRRLTDFREQMSAMDRDEADKVRAAVQKVHDSLLVGIMGGKKTKLER
jgi:hypothetical protein